MNNPILLTDIIVGGVKRDVLINDSRISEIADCGVLQVGPETEVVDCEGKTALPGFVNMHTHAGMTLMRGIGEDMSFHDWLDRIWKVEKDIDDEYVYHATRVACLEMIKSGTTTFNDQYWHMPMACKAASELGLRAVLSYVICDRNDPEEALRQRNQCCKMFRESLSWGPYVSFAIAVHAVYSVSEEMMKWAVDFAREHGLKIHMHLSETAKEVEDCIAAHGVSPVVYLDRLGILGSDVIAAHTLWLSDEDVEILGSRGVTCVHNVNSNLKLASGYRFRYNELRDAGANICIGTDGCASSNNLDMLEAIKTSAMIQKAWRGDPAAMPLDELMAMSSYNAGKALGLDVGRLEAGALADILIVDTQGYQFLSPGSFEADLIYSAHSDCIASVICNGHFVMRDRVVPMEKEIVSEARKQIFRLKNYQ